MEMTKRFATAARALQKLQEAVTKENLSEMERDGMIQRFEFCFEILWKCGKDYLKDVEGLEAASPKTVIRLLREVKMFTDEETVLALKMADDRNLTAHTYDENLAIELSARIRRYEQFMQEWYRRMTG